MPFDVATETPAIRRAMLSEKLRNDTEWKWNFCNSAGCAIGMARTMWGDANLCDLLGINAKQYGDIFGFIEVSRNLARFLGSEWSDFYGMSRQNVTPAMVAEALERIV